MAATKEVDGRGGDKGGGRAWNRRGGAPHALGRHVLLGFDEARADEERAEPARGGLQQHPDKVDPEEEREESPREPEAKLEQLEHRGGKSGEGDGGEREEERGTRVSEGGDGGEALEDNGGGFEALDDWKERHLWGDGDRGGAGWWVVGDVWVVGGGW